MFEKMKQLLEMQKFAKEAERRLDDIQLERSGLGGKVRVAVTGNQKVKSLSIDESLLNPGQKTNLEKALAELLNAAFGDAKAEAARAAMDLMKGMRPG